MDKRNDGQWDDWSDKKSKLGVYRNKNTSTKTVLNQIYRVHVRTQKISLNAMNINSVN